MARSRLSVSEESFADLERTGSVGQVKGSITLFCGPMFSGKTTNLINITRFRSRSDLKCIIVKYMNDKRHPASTDTVLTAFDNETQSPAVSCGKHLKDLFSEMMKYDVISIDEGQFVCPDTTFCNLLVR